ncbi:Lrp/AsnC family leucine-responsive transcriptional regulator [Clostridium beijerinckii]|uniref:Lrp/AsnC family transcriptional regulator n=1 Tax=Clostridium beijerinckii TaxID=1520 RepID=UPI001494F23E|nr:Lrp/AsnC family transcriptional regulator [Clostridium beijerinckii]NOW90139.1 Lrp/AsnC family leucine-responsive transcriptional regulator [Clostridium beijerinckii]
MKIDNTDIKILKELQLDSLLSIRELSKRVNLSPPSVADRIRKFEDTGIIQGYTIKINEDALDFSIHCMIQIDIKNNKFEKFKEFIYNHPRVIFCYRIAGHSCILLKLSVKYISEIEKFVDSISSLDATTSTHIIFSEIPTNKSIEKFFLDF